ncbi:MAG: hypothetical protein IT558_01825, partial [Alphaproteobacteria bacterium]|nr:hypothetical protein [Alphaproteobacteria bacterium]
RLFTLFLCLLFLTAPAAYAQTVGVRASDNEGYSRLILDWGKSVKFKTENSPGKLVLKFESPGQIGGSATGNNILGVKEISSSPLTVEIAIPEGSKARAFQAGSRVIVDVKDPPGGRKTAKKEEKKEEPPVTTPPVTPPAASHGEEQKTAEASSPPAHSGPLPSAPHEDSHAAKPVEEVKPEIVEGSEAPVPDQAALAAPPAGQQPQPQVPSNYITITSTTSGNLAVFERAGSMWIVTDHVDAVMAPQVSGPEAKTLLPLQTVELEGGVAYKLNALPGARIRAQGGGLLWRVMVPAPEGKATPAPPQRFFPEPPKKTAQDAHAAAKQKEVGPSILWPLGEVGAVIDVPDPVSGKTLKVVTVSSGKQYGGPAYNFIDFETMDSPVGLVVLPHVDDLEIVPMEGGIEITRPGGLKLTPQQAIEHALNYRGEKIEPGAQENAKRIYDFKSWEMGGLEVLDQNRNIILADAADQPDEKKIEGILTLAKMYLANGLWAEAQGMLDLAEDKLPDLAANPEFEALRGAVMALGWESEEAFDMLSVPELKNYPEIGYWRAFALADLGDWQQADEAMPQNIYILSEYPSTIRTKLSIVLAEVALRAGKTDMGEKILKLVERNKSALTIPQKAAFDYLTGETQRQRGKIEETVKLWKPLTTGKDDLYRVKAGLALTRLMVDKKQMKAEKAIDNLERLRYAWRGDDLEAQIGYWLGKTYFEAAQYVRGLGIMREAASIAEGMEIADRINTEMADQFVKLFMGKDLDKVPALDAAVLHDQFGELVPKGEQGDKIVERLAERLVKADLLGKAADLLQHLVEKRLQGSEAARVAVRLAAIHLLDDKPVKALEDLDKAAGLYAALPVELKSPEREREMALLRARALSKQNRADQALALLKNLERTPDVSKLRADIAWHAGYWEDAAESLEDVIFDRNISLTRPLNSESAALILQGAVALNLAGDRVGLANAREKYSDAMAQTDKAKVFEVVTRPRQSAALADRETLKNVVAEVDLFKDFMDAYRGKPAAAAVPSN